jgi:O-antigen/teichoic acid export membrane protein
MVFFRVSERTIGLASTVILARLLVPEDFGLVAMATAVVALAEIVGAFNFDVALIQKRTRAGVDYDSAWTLNIILGSTTSALVVVLAQPAAAFYGDPRLGDILYALACATLISSLENIGTVAFRQELAFRKEFGFLLFKKAVAFVVTISTAVALQSYWALVLGIIVGRLAGVGASYLVHPYRPRFSLRTSGQLLRFSGWLLINNLLVLLNARFADFAVGRVAGPHALGLYSIAYEVANLPTSELVAPINRAVFPGYASLGEQPERIRQGFLDVIGLVMLFVIPAGFGIAVLADLIVHVVLGPRWQDAASLISILAAYGVLQGFHSNAAYFCLAAGRPQTNTLLAFIYSAVLIPTILLLTPAYGALGAAWALVGSAVIVCPVLFFILLRHFELPFRSLLAVVWRSLFGAGVMYAGLILLKDSLSLNAYARLAMLVPLGALIYFASVLVLWRMQGKPAGPELKLLSAVAQHRRRSDFEGHG